ncbi:sulfatase family protein [Flavilitoribacter nigricans]|uniref:Sulfatase n=1 Tax=Flavilitoribacter nigricans (strain ATCC 23147 / DSM 23189 / NBRC 102662 / NCIMB 1420 / SS-2) TaxID=1122177 RepID=A0A2D0NCL1_FLAN2|nr:sulfatase [Flavilitoribacter nigricans]PHN06241.1 sulfatase [Flavilitoribacter nigricans DSM 23189 = NBRC 102662]
MNSSRTIFLLCLLASISCQSPSEKVTEQQRPNILFIMADDHTTQAISAYGGIFADYARTENIDQLAEEGMLFTNTYCTNAICSPSRATILTGKYSHKNGVRCLGQDFDGSQTTVQALMQAGGYQTAIFGKWHLRSLPTGFDDYKVLPVQGRYQDPQFHEKGTDSLITHRGWSTDVISQMTIDFLEQRDPDKPFLAFCHYKATHDPWASRPPYDTLWENEDLPEPANLLDDYANRSEAAKRTGLKLERMNQSTFPHRRLEGVSDLEQRRYIYQQYIKSFLRCGRVLDDNVGKVIQHLKETGLYDNTIIIYTADQGHFLGEHGYFSKRFMYDEAMRMPLIIRYPEWINAGTSNTDLVMNADFAPTLLDMAGLSVPEEMQGRSFLANLKGRTPEDWRTAVYYHYWQHLLHREVAAHYGIRTKDRKLIFYYGLPLGQTEFDPTPPEWEFFDLEADPAEMRNVYDDPAYSAEVRQLKQLLLDLQEQYEDRGQQYPELVQVEKEHFW